MSDEEHNKDEENIEENIESNGSNKPIQPIKELPITPSHLRKLVDIVGDVHQRSLEQYAEHLFRKDSLLTTKSQAELCLIEFRENVEKRYEWTLPCGIFLACFGILISIISSNQNFIFSISTDFLKGGFSILTPLSFLWTCFSVLSRLRSPKISEKDIIDKMDIR